MRWTFALHLLAVLPSLLLFASARSLPRSKGLSVRFEDHVLEPRARTHATNLNMGSTQYRKNAAQSTKQFNVNQATGKVSVTRNKPTGRVLRGKQADHIFEKQMVKAHLKANNLDWKQLDRKTQRSIRMIVNRPGNMAFIPGGINGSKGQVVRNAIIGKATKPSAARDAYIRKSYETAKRTARRLDRAYSRDSQAKNNKVTASAFLKSVMKNSGVMSGHPSPATSRGTSLSPPSSP